MTNIIFYHGKKKDSYPEDAIRLSKAALKTHRTKQALYLVFPEIKVPKTRLRHKIINKLASTIKLMLEYDDGNVQVPITLKNIKDGVLDHHVTLTLPEEMPERFSKLRFVLDDSYIHFFFD